MTLKFVVLKLAINLLMKKGKLARLYIFLN